jgi:hypothetical protein
MGVRPDEAAILLSRGRAVAAELDPDWDAALADMEASAQMFEEMGMIPDLVKALEALGHALKLAGREDQGAQRLARVAELRART